MARRFVPSAGDKIQKGSVGNSNTDNYTIFARLFLLKLPTSSRKFVMNGHGGGYGEGFDVRVNTAGNFAVDFAYVAGYDSNLRCPIGQWVNVVYVRRSGTSMFYAYGKKSPSTSAATPFTPGLYYTIGGAVDESGVVSGEWDGDIEEVALFSRALSEAECFGLSTGALTVNQVRAGLSQHHQLNKAGTLQPASVVGDLMTITNTKLSKYAPNVRKTEQSYGWLLPDFALKGVSVSVTPTSITKSLQYQVTHKVSSLTKALTYQVTAEHAAITKSLQYLVTAKIAITKSLTYVIVDKAAVLTDNFDDNSIDSAKWSSGAGVTNNVVETNKQIEILTTTVANYQYLYDPIGHDLTGSYAGSLLVSAGNQSLTTLEVYPIFLKLDDNNAIFWLVSGNFIRAYKKVATTVTQLASLAYDPLLHKYFRITESGGTTYWQYSQNGIDWTTLHSASNPIVVTRLFINLMAGVYGVELSTTTVKFDDFNIYPTEVSVTKSLQYLVKNHAVVTKSLQYAVHTVPTAMTKSLQYFVTAEKSVTKALAYQVTAKVSITKSLQYLVTAEVATLTKSLKYTIITHVAVTKSLEYVVNPAVTVVAITQALAYLVKSVHSLTKSLAYQVTAEHAAITKSLQYTIITHTALTKSLTYDVITEQAVTKALSYMVKTTSKIQRTLAYQVTAEHAAITKSLAYVVTSEQAVTKSLQYYTTSKHSLSKSLQYLVTAEIGAITKALAYLVTSEHTVSLTLSYSVVVEQAITKSLTYNIIHRIALTKSLAYAVEAPHAITKSLTYYIRAEHSVTKSLQYVILHSPYSRVDYYEANPQYSKNTDYIYATL